MNQRHKVLIIRDEDGWIEVYAGRDIDVHIVDLPPIGDFSARAQRAKEQFAELSIPRSYRDIFEPVNKRAVAGKPLTFEQRLQAEEDMKLLRTLERIGRQKDKPAVLQLDISTNGVDCHECK